MRERFVVCLALINSGIVAAQLPQAVPRHILLPPSGFDQPAASTSTPQSPPQFLLPSMLVPPSATATTATVPTPPLIAVRLPREENLQKFDAGMLTVRNKAANWQVWAGHKLYRDFGLDVENAKEAVRLLRDIHPSDWTVIGQKQPIVEYGFVVAEKDGSPSGRQIDAASKDIQRFAAYPRSSVSFDQNAVRAEQIRGVWCLRDDANILLNFGDEKLEAEQAAAVCRKYGFNRIGTVGRTTAAITYFFAAEALPNKAKPTTPPGVTLMMQERNLARTGIELPGGGYAGERMTFDPKRVEVRKERGNYVVAYGHDVFATFGGNEGAARDALRMIQNQRFNEFCRFGSAGVTFFLQDGHAPTNVPFSVATLRFDTATLRVREINGHWWLCDVSGRSVLPAGTAPEAEQLMMLLKAYGFDTVAQIGPPSAATLKFLAKSK